MNTTVDPEAQYVDYRHVWLYAKGHYKRSKSVAKDLGIIMGKRAGIDPEYFDRHPAEILNQLLPLVWDALKRRGNPENAFAEFVKMSSPEENWKIGGKHTHNIWGHRINGKRSESHDVRMIRAALSALKFVTVFQGDKCLLPIGKADPSILPLSKELKQTQQVPEAA
jgi:hypothetical protein